MTDLIQVSPQIGILILFGSLFFLALLAILRSAL